MKITNLTTPKARRDKRILAAAAVLVIVFFALLYSSISLWDPDFWWHINTGKYIVEHGSLPDKDLFVFTPMGKDMKANIATLKGYWLAQIVLYEVWKIGGVTGTIVFRVILLALTLWMVWRFTRGGSTYLRLAGLLLAGNTLFYFTGERPQIFVFPLTILLLMILQAYIEKRSKAIFLLPVVTLLWTNLHRSSLFAVVIILIYVTGSLVHLRQTFDDNISLDRRRKAIFTLVCLFSVATVFASPVGFDKIKDLNVFQRSVWTGGTIEFLSPFVLFSLYHKLYPVYMACLLIAVAVLLTNIRRTPLAAALCVIATLVLSLTGARYMVFLALTVPLLFRLPQIRLNKYVQKAAVLIALVPVVLNMSYFRPFNFSIRETYPLKSVSILKEKSPKRVFAYLEWGGFAGYFLPGARVFIDGKILSEGVLAQYEATLEGTEAMGQKEWKYNLDRYDVDTIILPPNDFVTGKPIALINRLLVDNDWEKIYQDDRQVLFVKRQ